MQGLNKNCSVLYSVKRGSASTKGSGSSVAGHSIPWERISNADVQVDIFSYATKDKEPNFQTVQADEESEEEDEEFKTALNAIVTDVKQDYTLIEAKSRMATSSPKKEQKPFQFPRPVASKPPAGLQNKQPPQVKAKPKAAPPKKPAVTKKKAGKKPAKQQAKPSTKTTKTSKVKPEAQTKDDKQEKTQDVKEAITTEEEKPAEPVRVDSETGEHEPQSSERTVESSALSRITSPRVTSSKASNEINVTKSDVPSESSPTSVAEVLIPVLVPRPLEPQAVQQESETEQEPAVVEQKPVQESRAARRAAERAAAAERRRQEVERKRREREEAKKRAMEEEARLEQLRVEAEEEMKRREEERR